MRVTREKLVDLARHECLQQAEEGDVVAGYLAGSVAVGEPLLAGTADIDLVLIHTGEPVVPRQIKPLSAEIHLDIAHHSATFYDQPRELRLHPWWGPAIAEPVFLHDPTHLFELAQASARGQFFRSDHVYARARAFLSRAQHALQRARAGNGWRPAYLRAVADAANAAASLTGAPATGRRAWLTLERRLLGLNASDLIERCLSLLGGRQAVRQAQAWIDCWAAAFDHLDRPTAPELHPARRSYWQHGLQALLEAGRPDAVVWPLLPLWSQTISGLPTDAASRSLQAEFESAMAACGLAPQAPAERCLLLEDFIDRVDERLDSWAGANGA